MVAGVRWHIGTAQNLGGRANQEDALGVFAAGEGRSVVALADGAGGHQGGEKASAAAIKTIQTLVANGSLMNDAAALSAAIDAANRAVAELSRTADDGPRTTLVVAAIDASKLAWAHVGDSRLYIFRNGKVLQRSHDDSVVQLLVDMNRISEEEALHHPDRNRLLKALGGGDIGDGQPGIIAVQAGDAIALCSDGVWEHVAPAEIAKALGAADLDQAARALNAKAVAASGKQADNASAILARLG